LWETRTRFLPGHAAPGLKPVPKRLRAASHRSPGSSQSVQLRPDLGRETALLARHEETHRPHHACSSFMLPLTPPCASASNSNASPHPFRKHSLYSPPIPNHLQTFTPESPKSSFYHKSRTGGTLWVRLSIRAQLGGEPPMSTLRQIEANRRNAPKPIGRTSVTGKAVSSMNSLQTGIHAKSLVLPSENVTGLQQTINVYCQSHRPATPETQLSPYAHQECCRADDDLPLRRSCSGYPRAFAQLQHCVNCTPTRSAEPDPPGFDPPSLSPSPQTTFTPKWLRLANPHPRPNPAAAHAPDPQRRPPPYLRFPACHNERLTAAGYPSRRRQTRQVD